MQPEGSLVVIAKDWLLIFVVIVQFFFSVSHVPNGPNKVSLVNENEEDDLKKNVAVCTGWKD